MTPATRIVPISQRLGAVLRYPLHPTGLAALAGLTVARLVNVLPGGLVGALLNFVVAAGLYAYASEVLRCTADGRLEPPEITLQGEGEGRAQIYLQLILLGLLYATGRLAGPGAAVAVGLLAALMLPGASMSLAMDGNFLHALNPATWLAIGARIGAGYVGVAALFAAIFAGAGLVDVVTGVLPPVVNLLAYYLIIHYLVLVAFHAMGYLIYQHHDVLGHEIVPEAPRRTPTSDPDQALLDEAQAKVAAGDAAGAEAMLAAHIERLGGTPAVHGRYRQLLRARGDAAALAAHGQRYLVTLMAQGREKEALDLARDCLAQDPGFRLPDADFVRPLAQRAAQSQQAQLALALAKGFPAQYPQHPDLPPVVLLTARLLVDRLGQVEPAQALLDAHRRSFDHHALRPDYDALRAQLAALVK